ncbi:hypothetical protein MNBD_GAMMA09-731 [hydrothermal vent metagenome]|uniref:Inner membrane protein YgaP-like transmembrane domain-containing protein n=1 Tax=hydrothermal vent metagenome TaxID=652676 RepID=A0A3B0XYU9_9ZZZZ
MKKNIGRFDQVLRVVIGLFLMYVGFFDDNLLIADSFVSTIIGITGVMNLFVSLVRYCPLYVLVDINTCPRIGK